MKFLLFLILTSLVIRISTVVVEFNKIKTCGNPGIGPDVVKGSALLFTVPYADEGTAIADVKFYLGQDTTSAVPVPVVTSATLPKEATEEDCKLCCTTCTDSDKLTGKAYLVASDFHDIEVYQWKDKNYTVSSASKYIVVFSKTSSGTTIKNFQPTNNATFTVYSGLPDDANRSPLYVSNANLNIDEIYLQEDHFHIQLDKESLKFDVETGGEKSSVKTFETNGFILSPGFPARPTGDDIETKINIVKNDANRFITFQIAAADENPAGGPDNMIVLAAGDTSEVTVTVGDLYISIPASSDTKTKLPFPGGSDSFVINGGVGYSVQFNIEDAPAAGTTVKPADQTTAAPNPVTTQPGVTVCNPAATCPPVTTCPTPTECPCATSTTTEISTTTQSATMSTVFSAVSLLFIHQLL